MFSSEIHQYLAPTRLIYGAGSVTRLGQEAKSLGGSRVLLVSDEGVDRAGLLQGALDSLHQQGLHIETFTDVPQDPDVTCVSPGVEVLRAAQADLVVAVGGGSPMCAAKAIALIATNGGTIRDYEGFGKVSQRPLPTICLPTTAGSGTGISAVTIITDEKRHIKMAIGSPLSYPPLAILDSELLLSLPFRQAAASGMDALSHAIEACLTTQATPLTDALALTAIRLMGENLVQAAETRDLEAKGACLLASSMANMACANARLGLNHALTWPISSLFGVPHGLANGIMLPFLASVLIIGVNLQDAPLLIASMVLSSCAFSALGLLFASYPTQSPGNIMMPSTLLRWPLLFISGIFIPLEEMSSWARALSFLSPLTYAQDLMNHAVLGVGVQAVWFNLAILFLFFGAFLYAALRLQYWSRRLGY